MEAGDGVGVLRANAAVNEVEWEGCAGYEDGDGEVEKVRRALREGSWGAVCCLLC